MTHPLPFGTILSAQARLQPNRIGARDLERSLTFARWNARSCQLANALYGLGLEKGARVAVLAYNRLEWAEIYAACAKAGLVAVPINFRLTGQEALHIIKDSGAAGALIVEDRLKATIENVRGEIDMPPEAFIGIGGDSSGEFTDNEALIARV